MLEQGLIHLYTGKGKGKTTAALGLALRASGAGLKVVFYQFLKPANLDLSERKAIEKSGLDITIVAQGADWNMKKSFEDPKNITQTRQEISEMLKTAQIQASKLEYDVMIFDELAYCNSKDLADIEDIKAVLKTRNKQVEIIITGSNARQELIDLADYVSQINIIKHPFQNGITARKGIEY